MDKPTVTALCPTYGRPPHLLENTLACWLTQDYPKELRHLLILDDLGNVMPASSPDMNWMIARAAGRFPSLPAKYNAMLATVTSDIVVVWEDDDVYLPHHISSCVEALRGAPWAHPNWVWTTYEGLKKEGADGRFHASLAFRTDFLRSIGGWPTTNRADFDQQLMAISKAKAAPGRQDLYTPAGRTRPLGSGYVFRWRETQAAHGQHQMGAPNDEGWYGRFQPQHTRPIDRLLARHDKPSLEVLEQIHGLNSIEDLF